MNTLKVEIPSNYYNIYIGTGLLKSLRRIIDDKIKVNSLAKKIAIITDSNVDRLYRNDIVDALSDGYYTKIITISPGEQSKTLLTAERIYNELLDFNLTRSDYVLAFGGGVVGDISGFVASTYLRGVSFIQVPTTLLAQVDSSVGGKVAVNLPRGKNLVGSFYHPEGVIIDISLLETLDDRYFSDGMAEVIKYGCIEDEGLFNRLDALDIDDIACQGRDRMEMDKIIYTCCDIKRKIVQEDERDQGKRMILNFGHTIGHAIERIFNYNEYTHGEAVSIGMYHITKKSEELGFTQEGTARRIKGLLEKFNLPYKFPSISKEKIINAIGLDKKNKGNHISLILLKKIGEGYIHRISINDICKFI